MSSTLEQIVSFTRERVARSRKEISVAQLEREAQAHAPRGFRRKLLAAAESSGFGVIAELKKASPSKGVIRKDFPVADLAKQLEAGGASALSVLTEEKWFQGSLEYLREASLATALPCLRKDFIVDEYQLLEARANRADAVLLIVAALQQSELKALLERARDLELDILVEVHDAEELACAADVGAEIIGVNSRNLKTLEVDAKNHEHLAALLPKNVLRVAESGIRNAADIKRLGACGYQAFLVGETLMREPDPGAALQELVSSARAQAAAETK